MKPHKQVDLVDILRESLTLGKPTSLTVVSDSMSPLLRSGDVIGLAPLPLAQLKPGQIVTFANRHEPADLITHRLASVSPNGNPPNLITWGDRTLMFDAPILIDDVVGLVVWRRRQGRILELDSRSGAWLSKKLAYLAAFELRAITGHALGYHALSREALAQTDQLRRLGKKRLRFRLLRRIVSLVASILAGLVEIRERLVR